MNSGKRGFLGAAIAVSASVSALALMGTALASAPAPPPVAPAPQPSCPEPAAPLVLARTGIPIESAAIDARGRMFTGHLMAREVYRIDSPGAEPVLLTRTHHGTSVGGVAFSPAGRRYVGVSTFSDLPQGDTVRSSGILELDPDSGEILAEHLGLSAANGLVVDSAENAYATNDLQSEIGRVAADGTVDPGWASLPTANGAVLDKDEEWLYVARSFVNPGVSRISLGDPAVIESVWDAPPEYAVSAPDGLALDSAGRVLVPTNATGQVLRIDNNQACVLADGLLASTQVVYGRGAGGFSAGHLYRVGFDGVIAEIPAGYDGASWR